MDDLQIICLALFGYTVYKLLAPKHTASPTVVERPVPTQCIDDNTPLPTDDQQRELATQYGWAITISKIGVIEYNSRIMTKPHITNLEARMYACAVLLGEIRDQHPNPNVSDQAANMLLAMGQFARSTSNDR